jgi:hypothetical protein
MESCDVCKMEFSSSTPNEAVADAKIKGLGMWGYVCRPHLGYAVPGCVTMLDGSKAPTR